ncbi:ABC transporter substrate-binding protein [Natronorubrum daqingense]|uniref:Multiple sugar transport system substrate-binding protein n=1 Tax=Natronorubrum daqingense TaxID=588898 RepID=A0A1N7D4K0_9EURY|nr:extracellular solute-binding protein [Natronorubrum daqingense]SIR70595.1 multiple sugar transport system substrate-binding protein [Natronorubrum daqingense]
MLDGNITRRGALGGIGVAGAGLVAGCVGGSDDDELHILTDLSSDEWQEYWENNLIPGYEEEYGLPVEHEYTGLDEVGRQRLATLMQAQDPPGIFHASLPEIGDLVNQGQLADVDDVLEDLEDEWGEPVFKYLLEPIDDQIVNIPHGPYIGCLQYREDLYDELDLEVPETWDDLLENAQAIDEMDNDVRGFGLSAGPEGKPDADFSCWLVNAGGDRFRWNSDDEVELVYEEDDVLAVFELLQELEQYSPDPASLDYGTTIEYWASGRLGQCIMLNAWVCSAAYEAGAEEVALNTKQEVVPHREGVDPDVRGFVTMTGAPVLEGATHTDGAKDFNRYMYGPDRHIEVSLMEPMRFLPPYESILEHEEYRSADVFQIDDGYFLERNEYLLQEIAPQVSDPESPTTPETLGLLSFDIDAQMINRLIVEEEDPEDVYEWGMDELERRFEDVKAAANY